VDVDRGGKITKRPAIAQARNECFEISFILKRYTRSELALFRSPVVSALPEQLSPRLSSIPTHRFATARLAAGCSRFLPVMLNVLLGRLRSVMAGMMQVPLRGVRVVRCQLVISGFVMRRCFAMMPGRVLVMFCCLVMMFCRLLGHESSSSTLAPVYLHGLHWQGEGAPRPVNAASVDCECCRKTGGSPIEKQRKVSINGPNLVLALTEPEVQAMLRIQ
jgi:hypothetical protein